MDKKIREINDRIDAILANIKTHDLAHPALSRPMRYQTDTRSKWEQDRRAIGKIITSY